MRKQHNRFFHAVLTKWNSSQWRSRFRKRSASARLRTALAFGAAALISSMAWAQDPSTESSTTVAPEANTGEPAKTEAIHSEVIVRGEKGYKADPSSKKFTQPLVDVPQTLTIIPAAAIEDQGASTLRDVLRNVPGISIQAGEGGVPAGDNLSVRGFNARTDIFIDSVRDFGGYSRDSFNLEQVEVVKGPSSSYSGRGSTGGSINLVSKAPSLDAFYGATLGIGTDQYKRTTIDLNQPLSQEKGAAFRLNGMWHDQEVSGREAIDAERWGIAPTLSFGIGTPTRLTYGYFHLSQENLPDYGIPWVPNTNTALPGYHDQAPPVDFENFYGLKDRDFEKTDTDIVTQEVEHDFTDKVNLRNILRWGRTKRDSVITAPRFASTSSTAINRQLQSRDQVDTIIANQTDLTTEFNTGAIGHSLVSGVELSRETSKNFARTAPTAPQADLFNPDPYQSFVGDVTRTGARTEATSESVGLYAFDTAKLTEWLDLTGGLRWDRFNVDYNQIAANNVSTPLARVDEMLSWRAGVVVKPTANSSVYASYGTSFNPSAEGLTLGNSATSTNNINTDPEESNTIEVGTKWDAFDRRLLISAALFRTEKTNARTEDPADTADVIVLEGEQRVDGAELGLAGNITDNWSASAGYTFLESEVTKSKNSAELGRELTNTPKHSIGAWTTIGLPAGFELGLGGQFVDSRLNSTTTPRKAPSYWLADAMLAYQLNQNLTFRLNGYNLFDKEYIDRVGGGHFIPGAGRSGVLTTEVKF